MEDRVSVRKKRVKPNRGGGRFNRGRGRGKSGRDQHHGKEDDRKQNESRRKENFSARGGSSYTSKYTRSLIFLNTMYFIILYHTSKSKTQLLK